MNICMNEEICTNVCASMDSQALWSCITYALQLSHDILCASSTSSSSR